MRSAAVRCSIASCTAPPSAVQSRFAQRRYLRVPTSRASGGVPSPRAAILRSTADAGGISRPRNCAQAADAANCVLRGAAVRCSIAFCAAPPSPLLRRSAQAAEFRRHARQAFAPRRTPAAFPAHGTAQLRMRTALYLPRRFLRRKQPRRHERSGCAGKPRPPSSKNE